MNTVSPSPAAKPDLTVALTLASLLERLDRSVQPVGAEQYRSVAQHLAQQFAGAPSGAELGPLLDAYPAAAELYENLNYRHAGLCRSGLDASLAAEMRAREVIARAMRRPEPGTTDVQI